jgi:hypothetical protein
VGEDGGGGGGERTHQLEGVGGCSVPVGLFRAHAALKVCHGVCVACGMWRVYK